MLYVLTEEMLTGANTAFNMYPGLAFGAAEVIAECGTPEQGKLYAEKMFNGTWGGTMCLTEPHAGSDVGAAKTTAKKQRRTAPTRSAAPRSSSPAATTTSPRTSSTWCSRASTALRRGPRASRCSSCRSSASPRTARSAQSNDVQVASIEHKMGINGSATCVLNFGENDGCVGELVGTVENVGHDARCSR